MGVETNQDGTIKLRDDIRSHVFYYLVVRSSCIAPTVRGRVDSAHPVQANVVFSLCVRMLVRYGPSSVSRKGRGMPVSGGGGGGVDVALAELGRFWSTMSV